MVTNLYQIKWTNHKGKKPLASTSIQAARIPYKNPLKKCLTVSLPTILYPDSSWLWTYFYQKTLKPHKQPSSTTHYRERKSNISLTACIGQKHKTTNLVVAHRSQSKAPLRLWNLVEAIINYHETFDGS